MKHIKELDSLRGGMSLWVVFGHVFSSLPQISSKIPPNLMNGYAVDVFIILSGFVIFSMINGNKTTYMSYITQRFFRLYPIYFFALLISGMMLGFTESVLLDSPETPMRNNRLLLVDLANENFFLHFLAHLSLLHGAIPVFVDGLRGAEFTILGQAWSISVEWQFYLIAPILFSFLSRFNSRSMLYSVIIIAFILILIPGMSVGYMGRYIQFFAIGFVSFFAIKYGLTKIKSQYLSQIFFAIAVISILFLKLDALPLLLWFGVLFVAIKHINGQKTRFSGFLTNKYMIYLGQISYSIYLNHMIVLYCMLYFINHLGIGINLSYFILPVLVCVVSILMSMLTYHYIEKPMIRLGKRLTNKSN